MIRRGLLCCAVLWLPLVLPGGLTHAADFDLILRGGRVVDGSGNPWFRADIALRGDRIAAVGDLADATADAVLDVTGMIVAHRVSSTRTPTRLRAWPRPVSATRDRSSPRASPRFS
jgi:hypothetical protein